MLDFKQFVKPFADVTVNTFKNFVGYDLFPRNPYFTNKEIELHSDITGVICVSGSLRGAVTISMKMELAKNITGKLIGSPPVDIDIDTDVVDAIGEITNIIAGNAKQKIPDGDNVVISLPTVVKGDEHEVIWLSNNKRVLCIPFAMSENRIFTILVSFGVEQSDLMETSGKIA